MPEVISKYPEVTLEVLKGAGARCGEDIQPKILTKCPKERFCQLPTGEMCVYGIGEIEKMTQVSLADFKIEAVPPIQAVPSQSISATLGLGGVITIAFISGVLGLFLGRKLSPKAKGQ